MVNHISGLDSCNAAHHIQLCRRGYMPVGDVVICQWATQGHLLLISYVFQIHCLH